MTKSTAKVIEEYKVSIHEEGEKRSLSLRYHVGEITLEDGTIYNIAQSGLRIIVTPDGKTHPELYIDLSDIIQHMVAEIHSRNKKEPPR